MALNFFGLENRDVIQVTSYLVNDHRVVTRRPFCLLGMIYKVPATTPQRSTIGHR